MGDQTFSDQRRNISIKENEAFMGADIISHRRDDFKKLFKEAKSQKICLCSSCELDETC